MDSEHVFHLLSRIDERGVGGYAPDNAQLIDGWAQTTSWISPGKDELVAGLHLSLDISC